MAIANQSDFLGGGGTLPNPAGRPPAIQVDDRAFIQAQNQRTAAATARANLGYDRTASQASSPQQQLSAHLNGNIGGAGGAYNAWQGTLGAAGATPETANAIAAERGIPQAPPIPGPPGTGGTYVPTLEEQVNSARQTGAGFVQQGNSILGSTGAQAQSLFGQGQGYGVQAPQITTGQNFSTQPLGGQVGAGGGPMLSAGTTADRLSAHIGAQGVGGPPPGGGAPQGAGGAPAPQAAAAPAFEVGARGPAPADVSLSQLGGVSNIAGQLGQGPADVSIGQLGSVGSIAGQLGAAPTVNRGNVGMVSAGAAPGAVAGQLGNLGLQNGAQQGMLSRLEGFLDSPEGPSVAEAQLRQAQAGNMADLIGAARSGRGGAGSQAQALRGAMSEGSAIMSDTVGQLATLRAQEEDMRRNRQLSAIGLGGQMAATQRGQDLSFRGQDLAALQGDQATALGARGQDLQGSIANQGAQLGLEQLQAQVALGARGQDLSALQGDQSAQISARGQNLSALQGNQATGLGLRGQDLSALQSDQGAQLGMRGQNLSALQGNQATALGARGQDVAMRGQDLSALEGDANRAMAAQDLALRGQLGLTGLGLQAQGQGLQYSQAQNALGLAGEGMAQDAINQANQRLVQLSLGNQANDTQMLMQQNALNAQPSFWEQMALNVGGGAGQALGGGIVGNIFGGGAPAGAASAGGAAAASSPNYYTVPYPGSPMLPGTGTQYSPNSIFNPADPFAQNHNAGYYS